jgi:hypothetical protein
MRQQAMHIASTMRQPAIGVASTPQFTWQARIDQAIRLKFPSWSSRISKEARTARRLVKTLLLSKIIEALEASMPSQGPVGTVEALECYISAMDDELGSVGDDAQLANVGTLSIMSNMSKADLDAISAVILRDDP